MVEQKWLTLRDGSKMPAFGLGTWKSSPGEVYRAVRTALEVGYRHLDCAAIYGNEQEVGRGIEDAIKAGDITREELWVTSKLWNNAHRKDDVGPALDETLKALRVDYLDLYLIHWPIAFQPGVGFARSREEFLTLEEAPLEETWEQMLAERDAQKSRFVGVSNMGPVRIEALTKSVGEAPMVDQVESHPHFQQRELLSYLNEKQILMTAYSPLGSTDRLHRKDDEPPLLDHEVIEAIATRQGIKAGQVLIAWALHRDTVVIPKSVNPGRIQENLMSLKVTLGEEDMAKIAALEKGYRLLDGEIFAGDHSPYRAAEIFI